MKGSVSFVLLVGLALLVSACDNEIDDGTPFAPSPAALFVSPNNTQVAQNGTVTFTVANASTPVQWTVSNTTLANIGLTTGILTAGTVPGSLTVTVTDANGKTATASVKVVQGTILITPSTLNLVTLPVATTDFNVTGNIGTVTFVLSGATGGYTGASVDSTSGVLTVTVMPTLAQGNQTLTLTASDGQATRHGHNNFDCFITRRRSLCFRNFSTKK